MDLGPEFHLRPGVAKAMLERTLLDLDAPLPLDYCAFMTLSNGGEGFFSDEYLVLGPLEELVASNRAFESLGDVKDVAWFGGNGGGEAFGFDWSADGVVVEGPMIGMERDQLLHCADTFAEFLMNPTGFKE